MAQINTDQKCQLYDANGEKVYPYTSVTCLYGSDTALSGASAIANILSGQAITALRIETLKIGTTNDDVIQLTYDNGNLKVCGSDGTSLTSIKASNVHDGTPVNVVKSMPSEPTLGDIVVYNGDNDMSNGYYKGCTYVYTYKYSYNCDSSVVCARVAENASFTLGETVSGVSATITRNDEGVLTISYSSTVSGQQTEIKYFPFIPNVDFFTNGTSLVISNVSFSTIEYQWTKM